MRRIPKEDNLKLWDGICSEYSFYPSSRGRKRWLKPKRPYKKYKLSAIWDAEQEKAAGDALSAVFEDEIYALVWQSDGFFFDPRENIPPGYRRYDEDRNCFEYFPEYYPDGDYHFFVSRDMHSGLFGHPWRKELIAVGEKMIEEIEKKRKILDLH